MRSLSAFARVIMVLVAVGLASATSASAAAPPIVHGVSPQAGLSQNDYDLMRGGGIDVLRLPLSWNGIQPTAGNCTATGDGCDWYFSDRQVAAAAANGLQVLLTVYGSPPFINADPAVAPVANIPAWEQFVRAAVQRYGPNGAFWNGPYQELRGAGAPVIPVQRWQIWNEPSSYQFFKPKPNTKQFAQILGSAGNTIKAADSGATVMLGGVFGETGPKGIPLDKFFKQLYKVPNIENSFDAVAVHPYAITAKGLVEQVAAIRAATLAGGDKTAKVWVTELGYSSGCPICKPNNIPPVVTENTKTQAKSLVAGGKALMKARKKLNLGGIIWFAWQDVNDPNSCRFCQLSGLVDINGQPKPAFFALQKLIGLAGR